MFKLTVSLKNNVRLQLTSYFNNNKQFPPVQHNVTFCLPPPPPLRPTVHFTINVCPLFTHHCDEGGRVNVQAVCIVDR